MIDLTGDRDIEWGYIERLMPYGPGDCMDFGCYEMKLTHMAVSREWKVTAIDLENHRGHTNNDPNVEFIQGDLLDLTLPLNYYDLIINCSSVEHVGLAGRYGVKRDNKDGDLSAMKCLNDIMKHGATQLLTIPIGRDDTVLPLHRIYGKYRLPLLLRGYKIMDAEFWIKDEFTQSWGRCSESVAFDFKSSWSAGRYIYTLGCFNLVKE